MGAIATLTPSEPVQMNRVDLHRLYEDLGPKEADEILCRALADISHRLLQCEILFMKDDLSGMRKQLRGLAAVATQIGLTSSAAVARHVINALDRGDTIALAATFARLRRLAADSLREAWTLPG